MKLFFFIAVAALCSTVCEAQNKNLLLLSENLLYCVKTETPSDSLQLAIARYSVREVANELTDDNAKKAFWLNIYNAYYQLLSIQQKKTKPAIFTSKSIHFSDADFSLDGIEHGILRRYRWKYSLGYLPQLFPHKNIKRLAVTKKDFRIHFALNCGAKSCPPIAFYNYEKIETQLDLAARSFLEGESLIKESEKVVYTTKIMQWFKSDFGGKKGIRKILSQYLNKDFLGYKIKFNPYNQTEELKNFN